MIKKIIYTSVPLTA